MNQERWSRLTIKEQMGNIASELRRSLVWEQKNDFESRNKALERALDLTTMMLAIMTKTRRREIARFKETIGHCLVKSHEYDITIADLENYCLNHL